MSSLLLSRLRKNLTFIESYFFFISFQAKVHTANVLTFRRGRESGNLLDANSLRDGTSDYSLSEKNNFTRLHCSEYNHQKEKKCHRNVFSTSKLIIWNENFCDSDLKLHTPNCITLWRLQTEDKTTQWHQM